MVRPVDQEVEPPWVEPKVDQAVRQVGQEVVRPSEEPKVDQTEQQVGLMVRQVGWQQEMVGVQVAPLVGHQILRVAGRMQVCLRVKLEGLAAKQEDRRVVHPSEGPKVAQADFEGLEWTTTVSPLMWIQVQEILAQKSPFQRHLRWFQVLLEGLPLIHPWPLEGAQVQR